MWKKILQKRYGFSKVLRSQTLLYLSGNCCSWSRTRSTILIILYFITLYNYRQYVIKSALEQLQNWPSHVMQYSII